MIIPLAISLLALAQGAPPNATGAVKPVSASGPAAKAVVEPKPKAAPAKGAKGNEEGKKAPEETGAPELTPEQIEARSLGAKALALFKSGEYAPAMEHCNKALALDPKYEIATRVLGWCAVATGDDRKAEAVLTRALNMNPADGELQFLLASCHKRLQEWGAAKDLLADLLRRDGPSLRVFLEMAECCIGDADFDGALAALDQARDLAPKDRDVVEHIVDVHEAREDWDKAAAELRTLIAAAPKEAPLRYRIVQAMLNAERLQDAARELEDAAIALGDDPQPHKLLETLYSGPLPNSLRLEFHRNWLKEWNLRRR